MINPLKGLGTALITPFDDNFAIDQIALNRLVISQVQAAVDYLVVLGTTGENATLSENEKKIVQDTIFQTLHGSFDRKMPLVLGLGGNDTRKVVEEIKNYGDFLKNRYAAILSVCPYYNKPTQEGLYHHFAAIASVSPVPVILYNVPSRTGVSLSVETVKRLITAFPNHIVGIKEASGKLDVFAKLVEMRTQMPSQDFLIICGDDGIAAQAMALGADGLISVASNAWPNEFYRIVHDKDASSNRIFQPVIDLLFKEGNPVGIKAVLSKMGMIKNVVRLPLVPCSESLSSQWDAILAKMDTLTN